MPSKKQIEGAEHERQRIAAEAETRRLLAEVDRIEREYQARKRAEREAKGK